MRVKKTSNGNTTLYGWDNDRIYAEYDASGIAIQETVYFGSTPIALLKDNSVYRIFADQIDTPRVIANQDNEALWSWESKPFGETLPNEDVDNDGLSLSYNLRFPGQYYDQETSKHYNFNRDYNPVTGRYIQSDPIGLDGGMNTFGYVNAAPTMLIDIMGNAATVIRDGTKITIQLQIKYVGPQAAQGPVYNAGIISAWEGANYTDGWTVDIDLTQGPVNTITVINEWYDICAETRSATDPVSYVAGVGGSSGTWNLRDSYGSKAESYCVSSRGELAAHEAGHLFGLDDKYDAGGAWAGWSDNIMEVFYVNT